MSAGMKRWFKVVAAASAFLLLAGISFIAYSAYPASGTAATGSRLDRMQRSPQWHGETFGNELARVDGSYWEMLRLQFVKTHSFPDEPIKIQPRKRSDFDEPPQTGLRVTWFGHSSFLVEIDGRRILVDPVWGERASPLSWAGPQRFFEPPMPLDQLPELDAIVISHDHYDHLDYPTVVQLRESNVPWLVPLGIGAHLEYWGVPAAQIIELDWWQQSQLGDVTLTCTPARHFSGRSLLFADQNATLWAGWAIKGPKHNVFYSGDTALHPEFDDIGTRLGPFDLTLMETGAYNALWADVHLGPEQAVIAHQMVRGKVMLPVHWGMFDLAVHNWTEPVERVIQAAEAAGVTLVLPRPGGWVEPTQGAFVDQWWATNVPWQTVDEAPAWSSSVDELIQRGQHSAR